MKLLMFARPGGQPEPGVSDGSTITPLAGAGYADLHALIADPEGPAKAAAYAASATGQVAEAGVRILAPLTRPEKILCVGLNYRDHAIESNMAIPTVPTIFSKFNNCIIGPGDEIVLPKVAQTPDYEAEFAVVIGKPGKNIAEADWESHEIGRAHV